MSNENELIETRVTPEVVEAVVTQEPETPQPTEVVVRVAEEEKRYEYQPTDETGRSLGGRQVIVYNTPDELAQKLTEQNVLLVRKLREMTKKQRLGINDDEQIPESALRFDTPVDFTPRQLSDDDRVRMSRDLLDPDRFNEAAKMLFEATVGANPEQIRNTLSQLQMSNLRLLAKAEADGFVQSNPDYFKCQENFETITSWMMRKNLQPVRDNFQLAYDTLNAAGLLLTAPIAREEVPVTPSIEAATSVPTPKAVTEPTSANSLPTQETPSRITTEEPAQNKRAANKVPTGLTRVQAGDAGVRPRTDKYTLREIDAMPSELLKKKILGEPGFKELYDKLLDEQAVKAHR